MQRIVSWSLVLGLTALSPVTATAQQESHGEAFHLGEGARWTGRALNSGRKFEFLSGISHPRAPYLLHIP